VTGRSGGRGTGPGEEREVARPAVPSAHGADGNGEHRTERVPFPLPPLPATGVPGPDDTGRIELRRRPPVPPPAPPRPPRDAGRDVPGRDGDDPADRS